MSVLAAVVRHGGFSAAARALGVSKQGLSDRVAALEAELGVRLLERTTRAVRPTEAGARYAEQCRALVALAEEANAGVRGAQVEPTGLLRVASTVSFGHAYVIDVVAEYLQSWPKVRAEVVLADRAVSLVDEGFDVAFWVEPPADRALVARPLGRALAYYVAGPSYLATHGEPASLADLARGRCIGWATEEWSLGGGRPVRVEPHLLVNSAQGALRAALLGAGVARLPGVLVGPHVAEGSLRVLFGGAPARSSTMCVVYAGRFVPAKTRRFLDLVGRRVRPERGLEALEGARGPGGGGGRIVRLGRTRRPR